MRPWFERLSTGKLSLPVCQLSLPRLANSVFRLSSCRSGTYDKKNNEFASLPRFLSRRSGVKAWFLQRPLIPPKRKSAARSGSSRRSPCHLANLYQESAFDGGIRRKMEASGGKLYRHVANSLASRGKVTVEGSSKGRKIMSAAGQGAGSIRLAVPLFHQPAESRLTFSIRRLSFQALAVGRGVFRASATCRRIRESRWRSDRRERGEFHPEEHGRLVHLVRRP